MFIIYIKLIEKYIHLLTPDLIKNYANSMNILIDEDEVNIIYNFILEHYKELLEDENTIYSLKGLIRDDLFDQIFILYTENKTKFL